MESARIRRHAKIVCTLGPASSSASMIRKLLSAGMDIVRLNLNYGTLEEHAGIIKTVRKLSSELDLQTGVLLDCPGLKKYPDATVENAFKSHLQFAKENDIDFVALSFISNAQQVEAVHRLLESMEYSVPLIVKIEKDGALQDSDRILEMADGIMVARGDLAIQISIEKVPLAQKKLIRSANQCGKPVITATQMLESMVKSPTPTRAEATDIANAVLDGTDALMLSEETSIGKYPVTAVETMVKIAMEAETAFPHLARLRDAHLSSINEVNDATARAACQIADQIGAKVIVAFTAGGTTALRVAKYRPLQPIIAVTPSASVRRKLSVVWGVHAALRPEPGTLEELFAVAEEVAVEMTAIKKGDCLVLTAGVPLMVPGSTNLVKVHVV
ncbi:MAG TPA: pyruvate kinase [Dehalococcoidales bacterium]|nr:pyruvate kinase [Dehalococcoidales bacterium]